MDSEWVQKTDAHKDDVRNIVMKQFEADGVVSDELIGMIGITVNTVAAMLVSRLHTMSRDTPPPRRHRRL